MARKPLRQRVASLVFPSRSTARSGPGHITGGGGLGGPGDGSVERTYQFGAGLTPAYLEAIYQDMWAVRKVVDAPVEDMLIRWRVFISESEDDEAVEETMRLAEERHMVRERLAQVMKAARLHGSAMLFMVTAEAPLDEPLDARQVRPGDLKALHVIPWWDTSWQDLDVDVTSPRLGIPDVFRVNTAWGNQLDVHWTRLIQFDGLPPITTRPRAGALSDRMRSWWWGRSVIDPVYDAVRMEDASARAVMQMLKTNSVTVLSLRNLAMRLGEVDGDISEWLAKVARNLSVWGILGVEDAQDATRLPGSPTSGAGPVLELMAKRVASAADIPEMRFLGESPVGFSSGEGPRADYAQYVASQQQQMLAGPLKRLDTVLARDAGLDAPPDYRFLPLVEEEARIQSETVASMVDAALKIKAGRLGELEEARALLRENELLDRVVGESVPEGLEAEDRMLMADPDVDVEPI